jgi:ATP-dependent Lon protease
MFPLGSVLFPYAVLPLHVFEERYRALTEACLAGDREFGVVLIERGSEVGGGDTRFDVGTVARIIEAGRLPDGRYVLLTVGTRRIRVRHWMPEQPYPSAEIEFLEDEAGDAGEAAEASRADVERMLRRVLALRAELGDPIPTVDVSLDADPSRASFEAATLAPLTPLDAQAVLEIDGAVSRLERIRELLDDDARYLELRLGET